MYQALYRKWRPQVFSDVVGQEHVTDTLRRQVALGRPSHAYLFTGTRGTGKTTCAKILARAVNCEHPVNGDPCNRCAVCRGILDGSLFDVTEMDAASNNGVDDVRLLREEAVYAPASAQYRVYIIDEVHMLSTPAFNALLKIIEEPPPHLLFILATTELHKVPATILSRCQRFSFRRLLPEDIGRRLRFIAGEERIDLTEDGAALLSRLADGALRDALSLLDQCMASGEQVNAQRVREVLGLAGSDETARLLESVLKRDTAAALTQFQALYAAGKDIAALLGELSDLLRDLLVLASAPQNGERLLSGLYDLATLQALSQEAGSSRLIYMATLLQSARAALPASLNRRTDAELCLLRLCDESLSGDVSALCARIERLEERGIPASPPPESSTSSRPAPAASSPRQEAAPARSDAPPWEPVSDCVTVHNSGANADGEPTAGRETPQEAEQTASAQAPSGKKASPPPEADSFWREVLERCDEKPGKMYKAFLAKCSCTLEDDLLTVRCDDEWTMELVSNEHVTAALRELAEDRLGRPTRVRFTLGGDTRRDTVEDLIRRGRDFEGLKVT